MPWDRCLGPPTSLQWAITIWLTAREVKHDKGEGRRFDTMGIRMAAGVHWPAFSFLDGTHLLLTHVSSCLFAGLLFSWTCPHSHPTSCRGGWRAGHVSQSPAAPQRVSCPSCLSTFSAHWHLHKWFLVDFSVTGCAVELHTRANAATQNKRVKTKSKVVPRMVRRSGWKWTLWWVSEVPEERKGVARSVGIFGSVGNSLILPAQKCHPEAGQLCTTPNIITWITARKWSVYLVEEIFSGKLQHLNHTWNSKTPI